MKQFMHRFTPQNICKFEKVSKCNALPLRYIQERQPDVFYSGSSGIVRQNFEKIVSLKLAKLGLEKSKPET